jgi:putative salt-induced outer membrane protein
VIHSGRVFAGYNNQLNEAVSFTTGLEYLQGINETKSYRLNWDAGLNSKIAGNFSLATTFSLRYDHNPAIGVKNTDTITAVSLVYQLL